MKRLLLLGVVTFIQACTYGVVNNATTGSGLNGATVTVIDGQCYGAGCSVTPVQASTSSGLYVFDAYSTTDQKLILASAGQEAVTLQVSKPGFQARTVYHKPNFEAFDYNGETRYRTQVPTVYLCPLGSFDADGDSICDAAEIRYGTNPYNSDTDGDRLSDAAELFGSNGVDLAGLGAGPRHRDILVEIDYYPGLKPQTAAIDKVVQAFADAPISNPDGSTGINLIIDLNQQIAAADVDNDLNPAWTDFDVIKASYFESRRERLFHYALFANQYNSGGSSGLSRGIPAHDFIVTLGNWSTPGGTLQQQAGTLMHELGHNLGLRHGGHENANRKPNYLSIMSYNYQLGGLRYDGTDGHLDYSRLRIAGVSERSLNEIAAFAGVAGTTEADLAHYGVRDCSTFFTGNASVNLDLDRDGVIEPSVSAVLDCDGNSTDVFSTSQNDWDNLVYDGNGAIGDDLLGDSEGISLFYGASMTRRLPPQQVESCMSEFE
jgi:hypothetical protein